MIKIQSDLDPRKEMWTRIVRQCRRMVSNMNSDVRLPRFQCWTQLDSTVTLGKWLRLCLNFLTWKIGVIIVLSFFFFLAFCISSVTSLMYLQHWPLHSKCCVSFDYYHCYMELPKIREITFPLRVKISLNRSHDMGHKEWTEIIREWEGHSRKTERHTPKGTNWVSLMLPVSGLWEGEKLKLNLGCRILPGAEVVKNLPVMQETWVQSMGQEDPLEKGMVTHSSVLAWRIPSTKPVPQSMGSQRVGRDWATNT